MEGGMHNIVYVWVSVHAEHQYTYIFKMNILLLYIQLLAQGNLHGQAERLSRYSTRQSGRVTGIPLNSSLV